MVAGMYGLFVPSDFKKYVAGWILGKNCAEKLMNVWKGSEFGQLANEIPEFKENLQNFCDNFYDLVQPFLTTKRLKNSELFQNLTFVHGDFHVGNICVTHENTTILYDWQCYGCGHGATELSHLLSLGTEFHVEKDREILKTYYSELTRDFGKGILVNPKLYPYEILEREVMIRFLSYATSFTSILTFADPTEMDALRVKKGMTSMKWEGATLNMFKRVFHILKNPERDDKTFILTGKTVLV
eukprot:TRINITY_DN10665_c0_g1_i3.p1 TRINITY_DN10665_c0_g1~~TRINITY_DN10665_c0_g1_i3.p1  ORF type:complete len:242 (-),score=45.81 TRINITY_DN10665_c0_g1_i3:429-1154(-)